MIIITDALLYIEKISPSVCVYVCVESAAAAITSLTHLSQYNKKNTNETNRLKQLGRIPRSNENEAILADAMPDRKIIFVSHRWLRPWMTREECDALCRGYTYMGLQNGGTGCFCGPSYGRYGAAPAAWCTWRATT